LADWGQTFDLDDAGAPLFREWLGRISALNAWPQVWAVPFDVADPANTPR